MLSRSTGYALMALVYLAAQPAGRLTGAREIAAATGAPMPFLWKILRQLSERKLTRSSKGVHGGYERARPANLIALAQVVKLTQRQNPATRCFLGEMACDPERACVLHETFAHLRESIQIAFDRTTIADLALGAKMRRSRKRLKSTG
jgi:Rrf2 family transcriptional regulator, iron-sulfur cluster assembly transcription factor